MNQLLLGASLPFVVGVIAYALRGFRATLRMLVIWPTCMALSALWAVIPDLPRLLGMKDQYLRLNSDPRCNIFWWHYSIDQSEADSRWFAVGFVLVLVALLFAAWRELRIAENAETEEYGLQEPGV